ncbi:MAG: ATP-binding protein, partial [Acidobacteriota bacterium]
VATVMLLGPDGLRLSHVGSPALPELFKKTLEAVALGPHAGTCAVAAWRRRPVQTEDIGNAPEWADVGDARITPGLRAAWAMPIVASSKRLLGAIGLYFRERRDVTPSEREAVELFALAAAIAIERQHASDSAVESDRRRDEFLAMLAHELRNPLAPIRTAAQLLGLSEGGSALTAKVQGVIERQVSNLTRIVDDLLDVSRITRGVITLQTVTVDVAAIAARAVESATPLIDRRHHRLTVSTPPDPVLVCADPARLEQVVVNLLANAAKFTPRGGEIGLRVASAGDTATITVTDNGRGIAATLVPYVFDMFIQGSRTLDRAEGGLGIGLTVAHRLMEMHGGSIAVRSEGPGLGSQFTLTLPRSAGPAAVDTPCHTAPCFAARKILVVEDRSDAAEMLALLLRARAHDVRVALDGDAALVAAAEFHPDVMLIDIGLPGMSGYDLAERIRSDKAHAHVSLVAVTGYGGLKDRSHALSCGFDEHMVKPIDQQALTEFLEAPPRQALRPSTESTRASWVIEPDFVE